MVRFAAELADTFVQQHRCQEEQPVGHEHRGPVRDGPAQADQQPTERMRQFAGGPTPKAGVGFLGTPGDEHQDAEHQRDSHLNDILRTVIEEEVHEIHRW